MSLSPEPLPTDLAEALAGVRERLGPFGSNVLFFPLVGSTNDVALKLAGQGDCEGAVVIADAQTSGRGRRGRSWFSPAGAGLYVSVILTPARARHSPERATALLTLTAGLALAEGIERSSGLSAAIKWPNDLLTSGRKLAGILAEGVNLAATRTIQAVVLGYGINVSPAAYPHELADRITSIESELGRPIDRAALCAETLAALARRYGDLIESRYDAILDAWRTRAPGSLGARVSWQTPTGVQRGITAGIDDMGALLVRVDDRIERLVAGEVQWQL